MKMKKTTKLPIINHSHIHLAQFNQLNFNKIVLKPVLSWLDRLNTCKYINNIDKRN